MRALNLTLVEIFLATYFLIMGGCGIEQNQDQPGVLSQPTGDADSAANPFTPAKQPPLEGPGQANPGSETQAVDVGNPKETGPKARLKFRIADAPIDGVDAFVIRVEKIYAVSVSRGEAKLVKDYSSLPVSVDLLQFAQGNAFELADAEVPANSYDHIVVKMQDQSSAFIVSGGMPSPVALSDLDLGQGLVFTNAISGALQFDLQAEQEEDVTMHVPLWKKFKDSGGQLSLEPDQELYTTGSVGGIRILDLPLGVLTLCATRSSEAPPPWLPIPIIGSLLPSTQSGNSDCMSASARSLAIGDIYLGHLPPADYRLDLYISSTLYISLPNLVEIVAGQDLLLDLSWVPLP